MHLKTTNEGISNIVGLSLMFTSFYTVGSDSTSTNPKKKVKDFKWILGQLQVWSSGEISS